MFSANGSTASRFTARFSSAAARIAAMMAAAPAMSDFIHSISEVRLSDSPPESKVMPLPVRPKTGSSPPPPR
jgi:hypothetical protein